MFTGKNKADGQKRSYEANERDVPLYGCIASFSSIGKEGDTMSEEVAGTIQLDLEIGSDLDKGIQEESSKLADRIQKQVDSMSKDMFKSLRECITSSLDKMNEAINASFDRTKTEMQSFIQQMAEMVKHISGIQMPYNQAENDAQPQSMSNKPSSTRAPPGISISNPKIKLDPQFDTEMFRQKYEELKSMMDAYDNQIMAKQAERKELLEGFTPNMSEKASAALDRQIMKLDMQIEKLQNAAERTNITLSAMDRQTSKKVEMAQSSTSGQSVNEKANDMVPKSQNHVISFFKEFASRVAYLSKETLDAAVHFKLFGIVINGTKEKLMQFKVVNQMVSWFKKAASALGAFIKKLSVAALNKFNNGVKALGKNLVSLAGKLLGIGSASKKASGGMGGAHRSVGQLIKSFTIFSLIFPLVSKGIMALGQNLMATLKTNSTFANSLNAIKSNLATAFTPILQAILPALNALMSALSTITAYIAAFIAGIFGKTYSQAKQATAGIYAAKDAMGAYGSAAKETAKQLGSLAGFDEINTINGQDNSGTNSGSGGGDASVYTPSDVDENVVSKWVQKLKELWEKGDYAGIGKIIGEQINKAVTSFTKWISWDNVGNSITEFTDGFCSLFNSLVSTINWENIGKMFGEGINTIARTIRQLLEGINWLNIGMALANGLNGIVHTVDWENLGATIGAYFQARINALYGFVTTADWPGIGQALADGVMGMINSISWDTAAAALAIGLSGLISSAHNFITNIDWRGLGNKIASSINTFFKNINWKDFGMTVSDGILGILNMLCNAVKEIDWGALGHDIADALLNIDWWGIITGLGDLLVRWILGLGDMVFTAFGDIAGAMWDGLCKGIDEFFSDPVAFIREHIVDPFVKWVKSLFGIHSPSTVMSDIGGWLIKGLFKGISDLMGWLLDGIGGLFGGIGDVISGVWDGILSTASSAWDGITGFLGDTWDGLKQKAADTWDDLKDGVSSTWDNIKQGASSAWDGICGNIGGFVSSISQKVSSGFNNAKNSANTSTAELKTGVLNKFGEINSNLLSLPSKLRNIGSDMFARMNDGINGKIGSVKSTISIGMDNATSVLKSMKGSATTWGSDMMTGFKNGIDSSKSIVTQAARSVALSVSRLLHFSRPDEGPLRDYETWMPDMIKGLSDTLTLSAPSFIDRVRSLASNMSNVMRSSLQEPELAFAGSRDMNMSDLSRDYDGKDDVDKMDTIITYLSLILETVSSDKDIMCNLKILLDDSVIKDEIVKLNKESIAKTGKPLFG